MKRLAMLLVMGLGVSMIPCSGAYLSVPDQYVTIQEAIDSAAIGDTVLVGGGEYSGPGNRDLDFRGKNITVRARSTCRINCESISGDSHVGFKLFTGESPLARLEGFTIVNAGHGGNWPWTAGICIQNQSSPTIVNCQIIDSEYGIITEATCNPVVANCLIQSNSSGGIAWGAHSRGTIINCLVANNLGNGISLGHVGEPSIINCTVAGNSGFGASFDESDTPLRNCIISNNSSGNLEVTICQPDIQYCLIGGGYPGEGNIDADPLFVSGVYGDHYISQIAAGQAADSLALNTGNELAGNICFDTWKEQICLDKLTTRTDDLPDDGVVDMGYHYPSLYQPTPTPSIADYVRVDFDLPTSPIQAGEEFYTDLNIENNSGADLTDIPLFCLMEINGLFFFYPTWSTSITWDMFPELAMGYTQVPIIGSLIWPAGVPDGAARFYSVLLNSERTEFLSNLAVGDFNWE